MVHPRNLVSPFPEAESGYRTTAHPPAASPCCEPIKVVRRPPSGAAACQPACRVLRKTFASHREPPTSSTKPNRAAAGVISQKLRGDSIARLFRCPGCPPCAAQPAYVVINRAAAALDHRMSLRPRVMLPTPMIVIVTGNSTRAHHTSGTDCQRGNRGTMNLSYSTRSENTTAAVNPTPKTTPRVIPLQLQSGSY
jgi:hypothetical protein